MPIKKILILVAVLGLSFGRQVQAMGLGVTPADLQADLALGNQVEFELTVLNNGQEVGIYDVYADERPDWFIVQPAQFRLQPKERQKVSITVKPEQTGAYVLNLSVVGRSLQRQSFNAASGLKVPVVIKVSASPSQPVWLWYLLGLLAVLLLILIYIVIRLEQRRRHPFKEFGQQAAESVNWLVHGRNKWYHRTIKAIKYMNKSSLKVRLLVWAAVLVVILLVGYLWQYNQVTAPTVNNNNIAVSDSTGAMAVSAYLKIEGVYEDAVAVQAVKGQTLLGLMRQMNEADPTLLLETQDYPGLGSLVVQIGNLRNGTNDKYWQYYVNGEMPMVGADAYIIKPGDRIEWKFMESEF